MFAVIHAPTSISLQGFSLKAVATRMIGALVAAEARAKARRDYERMMGSDETLRDIGVSREDARRAMDDMH